MKSFFFIEVEQANTNPLPSSITMDPSGILLAISAACRSRSAIS